MTVKLERRFCSGLELREASSPAADGRIATLAGYAAIFNSLSEDLGGFREFIRAGAFSNSLNRGDDIRAFFAHDSSMIIGRRSANTLTLTEDAKGLAVEIAVPDTSVGRDLVVSVKRRDLTGMSFGFNTVEQEWTRQNKDGDLLYRRELLQVDLFEVSPVAFPAYADTSVEARGDVRSFKELFEEGVRLVGKDAPAGDFARRDRITRSYRTRSLLWTKA